MRTLLILTVLWCSSAAPLWAQEFQNSAGHFPKSQLYAQLEKSTLPNVQGLPASNFGSVASKFTSTCQAAHPEPPELSEILPDLFCCSASYAPSQQNTCLQANLIKLKTLGVYLANLSSYSGWAYADIECAPAIDTRFNQPGTDPDAVALSTNYQNLNKCLDRVRSFEETIKEKFGVQK